MFYVVLVCLFVCLSVCHQDYLQSKEQICIKLLPEVCLGPRNKQLHFVDDPNYKDYYSDRAGLRLGSRSGGLLSSTFCLVSTLLRIFK